MRYDVGRFRRPMRRSTEGQLMSLISLGDGSTLSLDFTTGVLDPRLTFTRAANTATVINSSGYVQTVNANTPRFDYDPTTLAPRGLLIEGSATNLVTRSDCRTTGWSGINATGTNDNATAPDNTTTATLWTGGSGGNNRAYSATFSITNGTTYTASVYVKKPSTNAARYAKIDIRSSIEGDVGWPGNGVLDLDTGIASGTGFTATAMPNGWYRIVSTGTANTTTSARAFLRITDATGSISITSTNALLWWGAQVETGSGASSYIPTGASQATRNPDNCYIYDTTTTGGLSWFKTASQGTFYVEMFKRTAGTVFAAAGFGTRATSLQDFMLYQAVGNNWLSFNWGAGEYFTNYSALSSPFLIKAAVALSPSTPATEADSTVSINGSNTALNTGPNIKLPFTSDLFCVGARGAAGGAVSTQNYAETAIRRIKFFPFAMTAAQMNAMTTL